MLTPAGASWIRGSGPKVGNASSGGVSEGSVVARTADSVVRGLGSAIACAQAAVITVNDLRHIILVCGWKERKESGSGI